MATHAQGGRDTQAMQDIFQGWVQEQGLNFDHPSVRVVPHNVQHVLLGGCARKSRKIHVSTPLTAGPRKNLSQLPPEYEGGHQHQPRLHQALVVSNDSYALCPVIGAL